MKKLLTQCISSILLVCLMVGGPINTSAASRTVPITSYGQTVDSLNGVPAKYLPGTGNTNTGDYSCAGLVKAYYSKIFHVSVYNLLTGCTPTCSQSGYSFKATTSNIAVGDVVYHTNSSGSGHWALVKAVNGSSLTLLEQNWKWKSGSTTYCSVERVVSFGSTPNLKVFKLYKGNTPVNSTSTAPAAAQPSASSSKASAEDVTKLLFNADLYYKLYPDLRAAFGYNPTALYNHWITCGINEGRVASLVFDAKYYLATQKDVSAAYGATNYRMAYNHFVSFGFNEGRQGSPCYHAATYVALYPDLKQAFGNNWLAATQHYLSHLNERRTASSTFSISAYTQYNPDVARAYPNALDVYTHFISCVYRGSEHRRCT